MADNGDNLTFDELREKVFYHRYGEAHVAAIEVFKGLLEMIVKHAEAAPHEERMKAAIDLFYEQGSVLLDREGKFLRAIEAINERVELEADRPLEEDIAELQALVQRQVNVVGGLNAYFGDKTAFPAEIRGPALKLIEDYLGNIQKDLGIIPQKAPSAKGPVL